jgi:hypothetical protein
MTAWATYLESSNYSTLISGITILPIAAWLTYKIKSGEPAAVKSEKSATVLLATGSAFAVAGMSTLVMRDGESGYLAHLGGSAIAYGVLTMIIGAWNRKIEKRQ